MKKIITVITMVLITLSSITPAIAETNNLSDELNKPIESIEVVEQKETTPETTSETTLQEESVVLIDKINDLNTDQVNSVAESVIKEEINEDEVVDLLKWIEEHNMKYVYDGYAYSIKYKSQSEDTSRYELEINNFYKNVDEFFQIYESQKDMLDNPLVSAIYRQYKSYVETGSLRNHTILRSPITVTDNNFGTQLGTDRFGAPYYRISSDMRKVVLSNLGWPTDNSLKRLEGNRVVGGTFNGTYNIEYNTTGTVVLKNAYYQRDGSLVDLVIEATTHDASLYIGGVELQNYLHCGYVDQCSVDYKLYFTDSKTGAKVSMPAIPWATGMTNESNHNYDTESIVTKDVLSTFISNNGVYANIGGSSQFFTNIPNQSLSIAWIPTQDDVSTFTLQAAKNGAANVDGSLHNIYLMEGTSTPTVLNEITKEVIGNATLAKISIRGNEKNNRNNIAVDGSESTSEDKGLYVSQRYVDVDYSCVPGTYLETLTLDGEPTELTGMPVKGSYHFIDMSDHKVVVTCKPIPNPIDKDIVTINGKQGSNLEGSNVLRGNLLEYKISTINILDEEQVTTVVDKLDPQVEFYSATENGVYDPKTHTVTWKYNLSLTVDPITGLYYPDTKDLTVVVKVRDTALGRITNGAEMQTEYTDGTEGETVITPIVINNVIVPVIPIITQDKGRTCQDDGYPKDFYWNGTACVSPVEYRVPNTGVR